MKRMIFKFVGGPLDGKIVGGAPGMEKEGQRYYALTNHGQIGQRFHTASDHAIEFLTREQLKEEKPPHFQQYMYEVVDRIDNGEVLIVLIQYVEMLGKGDEGNCTRGL